MENSTSKIVKRVEITPKKINRDKNFDEGNNQLQNNGRRKKMKLLFFCIDPKWLASSLRAFFSSIFFFWAIKSRLHFGERENNSDAMQMAHLECFIFLHVLEFFLSFSLFETTVATEMDRNNNHNDENRNIYSEME